MTGEQLKMEGIERVKTNSQYWQSLAADVIRWTADKLPEFSSEDIRARMAMSHPHHPNAYGAAFNTAAKAGIIKRIGYRKSTSPSAHSRVVSVWTKA